MKSQRREIKLLIKIIQNFFSVNSICSMIFLYIIFHPLLVILKGRMRQKHVTEKSCMTSLWALFKLEFRTLLDQDPQIKSPAFLLRKSRKCL